MVKTRKRLSDFEAEKLGFDIMPKDACGRNHRYGLDSKQLKILKDLREFSKSDFDWSQLNNPKYLSEKLNCKITTVKEKESKDKPFVLSAWNDKGYMMDINQYCEHYKLPRNDIHSYKLVSHTGTPYYNIQFKDKVEVLNEINFDFINEIVKKHIKPIKSKSIEIESIETFDKLTFTDVHIGMTTNGSGSAMYSKKWDKEELMNRCQEMCLFIEQNSVSETLVIDDLGDFLDGWNGETTRKGHHLPQNMTNKEMFDNGLSFKVVMIDYLINFYDKIIVNNICEDNHAGDFGYVLNSAFKSIIEQKYQNVEVTNHKKFMNHYYIGKHCFVISHGKDSHALKFGFKPFLDSKQIEKIDQYLKQNDIYKNAEFIEFSKGDSHQMLFDYCTSDDFDYFNYPAFSPSSEWVQTNFKKGRSGFVFSTIEFDNNIKEIKPYFFK